MVTLEDILKKTETIIKQQARIQIMGGIFIVLLFTTLWVFNRSSVTWSIISLVGIILGSLMIYFAAKKMKYTSTGFEKSIRNSSKEIVWVYHHVTQVMPFGIFLFEKYSIYIHLINGKSYYLRGKKADILFLKMGLESQLNHASFGYSIKKEQLYKANPALLLND